MGENVTDQNNKIKRVFVLFYNEKENRGWFCCIAIFFLFLFLPVFFFYLFDLFFFLFLFLFLHF